MGSVAGHPLDYFRAFLEFPDDPTLSIRFDIVAVRVRAVSDDVSLPYDLFADLRILLHLLPYHEGSRLHTLSFQDVEDFRGELGVGAVVEGEGEDLVLCGDSVYNLGLSVRLSTDRPGREHYPAMMSPSSTRARATPSGLILTLVTCPSVAGRRLRSRCSARRRAHLPAKLGPGPPP
jgi:hypothetical protein